MNLQSDFSMQPPTLPILGPFGIEEELGSDRCGVLYRAQHHKDRATYLIRAISPEIANTENFFVRYEVLRSIIGFIRHPHLVTMEMLDCDQNIFYIAKKMPPPLKLADCDFSQSLNRQKTFEDIFSQIASVLSYLETFSRGIFRQGIWHDQLRPDRIFLESADLSRVHVLVDGIAESFLFWGDEPQAILHAQMAAGLGGSKDYSYLLPASARQLKPCKSLHQYSFGALAYSLMAQRVPRGIRESASSCDVLLDPDFDAIIDDCLGQKFSSMHAVLTAIEKMQIKNKKSQPSAMAQLASTPIPAGMALVACHDKVELGAADGPLTEQPRFRLPMKPFFMDVSCVTVAQMQKYMPSYKPSTYSFGPDFPATLIPHGLALAYCDWRSEQEGLPKGTYRLPTEFEWETACRGQTGEQYPWGADMDPTRLHCGAPLEEGAVSVTEFLPARFGLLSMLGNVWEWTSSNFGPHPFSDHVEKGYGSGLKVVKGGCWFSKPSDVRASMRSAFGPREIRANVGFRCVRDAV